MSTKPPPPKEPAAGPGWRILPPEQLPAKIEGMAFGEDVVIGGVVKHTLYVTKSR